jgi:F-type H+-transporting ATPase subunit gamma
MQIDWLTVAAQIVNFLVLVWLLRRFLYGPITAAMNRREQRIAAKLAEADQRRAEAETAAETYREAERDLERRTDRLLADARKMAETERHDLERTARREVQELRQAWERKLDDEKTVFLGDVRRQLLDHAFALARHTIDDLADRRLEEQMTSAHQYDRAVSALQTYRRTIELGFQILMREPIDLDLGSRDTGPAIAIPFGSDHGLCGRFNDQIVQFALAELGRSNTAVTEILWLPVGVQIAARLDAQGETVDEEVRLPGSVNGLTATTQKLLLAIDGWRTERAAARVVLLHNRRTDQASAETSTTQIWPLERAWLQSIAARPWPSRRLPAFTMKPDQLFASLVRQHLFVMIFRAGAESLASEHATRLMAMQAAERNIDERLDEMNGRFSRMRQQSITEELLDVVAGFESLTSGHDLA